MNAIQSLELKANSLELIISEKMSHFTAIDLMRKYQAVMHETINWHEFSSYLDNLYTKGIVKVVGHNSDGMTIYSLNK